MVKEWFKNFLATTALTLVIISGYAWVTGDTSINLLSVFPSVVANAIIHIGLLGIRRLDIENYIASIGLEAAFAIAVVVCIGYLVGWFRAFNVWASVAIALTVFALACLINIRRLNNDVAEINAVIIRKKDAAHGFIPD